MAIEGSVSSKGDFVAGVAGRSGRKAFVPNPDQRHIVRTLTRLGIPQKHICRVVTNPQTGKPLDAKSLRKHFALEIRTGAAELHSPRRPLHHRDDIRTAAAAWHSGHH